MDDAAFVRGPPEVEIDKRDGMPVAVQGERGKMGRVVLTNDRIVFSHNSTGASGSLVGGLVEGALQDRAERKAGGPQQLVSLAELRGGRMQRRRLLPDLYELTRADNTTCRLHRKLRKRWDATIRRLLSERHGLTVTDDGDGWRAEPS
jgi:hypothetical protein